MRSSVGYFTLGIAFALGLLTPRGSAAETPVDAVIPPRVVHFVQAARPDEAPDQEVAVLLEFTVDEAGQVSDVRVVESGGAAFDRAALDAVSGFEFAPARRGERAVSAKIAYRYVFEKRAPEPPKELDPAREPEPEPEPVAPLTSAPGAAPPKAEITADSEYGATAEVEAPPSSAIRRSFKAADLARTPGARGDAIGAIEIMPGVARAEPFNRGAPLIRGSSANESQVFLDGAPVPLLFHLGAVTSFFQSRLLDRVDFYPGNFSVRYGRVTGGVVDAHVRKPRSDGLHGVVDLSVIDSAALVEAPLGDELGVAFGARRSNVDFFFQNFVPGDAYSVVAAPVYYDYQALAHYAPATKTELRLMAYGSRDAIELLFANPNQDDPALRGSVGGSVEFHHVNAQLKTRLSEGVLHTTSVTFGFQDLESRLGPLRQELRAYELSARSEFSLRLASAVEVNAGFDFAGQLAHGRYIGPRPTGWDDTDPTSNESNALSPTIHIDRDDLSVAQPAGFLELLLRPSERVLIVPGVRADYFHNVRAWSVDPRLSSRLEVGGATTLKAGAGLFSQPPQWYEALQGVGNPSLRPYHAVQLGAGVEQKLWDGVAVGLEGFYKRSYSRVVGTRGGAPPYLVNEGDGRVIGAELAVRVQPTPRTFGYLSYTLSRSERRDHDAWYLWNTDQTHVLALVLSQRLGRGWEVGGRFRFVTGNPETPVAGSVYDARLDRYRPLYGGVNSERRAPFQQLDVRVEKQWHVGRGTLAAYVEVLNAYNAQNPVGTRYSYDYSKHESVSGLPILPNIGIRGEL